MATARKTLSIIMPVYNEKNTVVEAIEHTKKVDIGDYGKEIIVVDDGSTDGSRELIGKVDGVKKVILDKNRGKGGALKEGIKHATGDYIVFHDADLEYEPADFKYMLPILDSGLADVVIGSRFVGRKQYLFGSRKNVLFRNYVGNMIIKLVWNILYQHNLTDVYPCYKLMRLSDLKPLQIKADGFVFDLEMMLKLKRRGKVYVEVPIHFRHRDYKAGKKIGMKVGFLSLWYMLWHRFFD
ncbi:MAG TPA: glycosyltransferase family 2 protein [Candidatus Nanoarchaeia archaeon]|nr:glycosyltransferase family 2 protein [Candidatus Nanoarchaeia archaeon]